MKPPSVKCRTAQRVAYTARGIDPDHDRRQDISTRAMLPFSDCKSRRAYDCNGVHDCSSVMAFHVAIVAERSIHQRRGRAVGPKRGTENLGFLRSARFGDEALQHGSDVIPR